MDEEWSDMGSNRATWTSAQSTAADRARVRREALEEAALVCEDVDEPPWFGYECPNTFDDGKRAGAAAIRALKEK